MVLIALTYDRTCRRRDRRRRHLRHRRRLAPAEPLPAEELRDPGAPRRPRRHLGSVPLPRHPLRLRHVHPRLPVPAVDAARRPSPTARRSWTTSARPREEYGIDRHIRFGHRVVAADWSTPSGALDRAASSADGGRSTTSRCSFLFACSGYYDYDGATPRIPRHRALRGPDRPSAALARGPRLRAASGSSSSAAAPPR